MTRVYVKCWKARVREAQNNKQQQKKKSFHPETPEKQKKLACTEADVGSALCPSNLLCSQLPAPAIRSRATGGHSTAIFAPMAPFLSAAFKVLHCDVHRLDVCLVPYMQSYHYPCLLTIAGPAFVTSAALRLGLWHDCTVDLFSFTYRTPCLSVSLCADFVSTFEPNSNLTSWKLFHLSAGVTPRLVWSFPADVWHMSTSRLIKQSGIQQFLRNVTFKLQVGTDKLLKKTTFIDRWFTKSGR